MPVVANRTGNTATVTITFGIGDIIDAVGISNAEKKKQAFMRAAEELRLATQTLNQTDADLDAEIAAHQAQIDKLKASKPTGNL